MVIKKVGSGKFYHVIVRPKSQFVMFRNHDVGRKGHVERLAGKRKNGNWATHSWLIDKREADIIRNVLVGKNAAVRNVLSRLRRKPVWKNGDVFTAGPEINIREVDKPTPAMKNAWKKNIGKVQKVRVKK
ncbi:hypothetical protein HN604_01360 [archaeon]|jgi:hypothetical protein|nr:hypothetical protein [archaeon]MBT6183086.1 hypothetical protein [archaeon]MBT6606401.1 hypothetical protein [archaeon]MBT7251430.1 hypothetical protein [archaeon]MBT7660712.1 hypothetical protein [archaeon]